MADQDDGEQLRSILSGSSQHAEIASLCMYLEQVTAPLISESADQAAMTSQMMTAACTFAGMLLGKLIVVGIVNDQDKRKAAEAAAKNFRTGIDVGKKAAMRIAREQVGVPA